MSVDLTEEEIELARRCAISASKRWSLVDDEDVIAELNLWLCVNNKWVTRYREEGHSGRYKLAASLKRAAHTYCAKEQQAATMARKEDVQFYTRPMLQAGLPYMFDFTDWPQASSKENPHTGVAYPNADTGEGVAILSDMANAYYRLNKQDQLALRLRFEADLTYGVIAERLQIKEDAARKRVNRALDKMLRHLSGDAPIWSV